VLEAEVQLVDRAVGLEPRVVLGHPPVAAEPGLAAVADAGGDLGDAGYRRREVISDGSLPAYGE